MTANTRNTDEPLPYLEITREGYAEVAARTLIAEQPQQGLVTLRGPCPRCGALIEVAIDTHIIRDADFVGDHMHRNFDQPDLAEAVISCNCGEAHPNRPEGGSGCGAHWIMKLTVSRSEEAKKAPRTDQSERAIELIRERLAAVTTEDPNRGRLLSEPGLALRLRFERIGERDVLDEAIAASRAAVASLPAGHPDRAGGLSNLGLAL